MPESMAELARTVLLEPTSSTPVILVEGPAKADTVAEHAAGALVLGITGVDGWSGGNSTILPLLARFVVGRRVYNLVDGDTEKNPNVRRGYERWREALRRAGAASQAVGKWDRAHKGIDDYLAANPTEEALTEVLRAADQRGDEDDLESCIHVWDLTDLRALPPPQDFVLDRMIGTPGSAILSGPTQSGKSTWTAGLAAHRALGEPYLDRSTGREGPQKTIIFTAEDGESSYRRCLLALRHHHKWSWDKYRQILESVVIVNVKKLDFRLVRRGRGGYPETDFRTVDEMSEIVAKRGGAKPLVFIETVSRVGGGEDNEAASMLIRASEMLASNVNGCTALIHHSGKGSPRNDAYGARGASAFADNPDSALAFQYATDEHAKLLLNGAKKLPVLASGNKLVVVMVAKCKGGGREPPPLLYELRGYNRGDLGDKNEATKNVPMAAVLDPYVPTVEEVKQLRSTGCEAIVDAIVGAVRDAQEKWRRGERDSGGKTIEPLSSRRFLHSPWIDLPGDPKRAERKAALDLALSRGLVFEVESGGGKKWNGGGVRLTAPEAKKTPKCSG